jgi:hypothetical protein
MSPRQPKRIQLRRTKGWRLPDNSVIVSRPTKWGNPFRIGVHGTREECVRQFRDFIVSDDPSVCVSRSPSFAARTSPAGARPVLAMPMC